MLDASSPPLPLGFNPRLCHQHAVHPRCPRRGWASGWQARQREAGGGRAPRSGLPVPFVVARGYILDKELSRAAVEEGRRWCEQRDRAFSRELSIKSSSITLSGSARASGEQERERRATKEKERDALSRASVPSNSRPRQDTRTYLASTRLMFVRSRRQDIKEER